MWTFARPFLASVDERLRPRTDAPQSAAGGPDPEAEAITARAVRGSVGLLLALVLASGCSPAASARLETSPAHHDTGDVSGTAVRYEVECRRCEVRYRLPGHRPRIDEVEGGWSRSFRSDDGERLTLTVAEADRPSRLEGRIVLDGEVVRSERAGTAEEQSSFTLTLVTGR